MATKSLREQLETSATPPAYAFIHTKEHKDLSALASFPSITSVYLHGATKKVDLTPLTQLPALESLTFSEPTPDLRIVPQLAALRTLVLSDCKTADLAQLAGSPLTVLLSPRKAVDLAPLAALPALRHLNLRAGFAALAGLPLALESLSVEEPIDSLAPIADQTGLVRLTLRGSVGLDLTGLSRFVALTSLELPSCAVADLSELASLTALTVLDLSANKPLRDLAPLAGLVRLAHLNLYKTSVADLSPLAGLTALGSLNVSKTRVASVAPLAGLTALTQLYAERSKLANLSGVEGMSALETLYIEATKVRDLAPLAGLSALSNLSISKLGAVQGTSVIPSLPALTMLDVTGTTFDPQLLVTKPAMQSVRGCEYPPPGARRLNDDTPPLDAAHMGPGAALDGRYAMATLPATPYSVALSNDGAYAAAAMYDPHGVAVVQSVDGQLLARWMPAAGEVYTGVAFAPDDSLWVLAHEPYHSSRYTLSRWDWQTPGAAPALVTAMTATPNACLYASRDGQRLAVATAGEAFLLDASGAALRTIPQRGERHYTVVAGCWSADGRAFYYNDGPGEYGRYDVATGERVEGWKIEEPDRCVGLMVSDDGRWLYAQGEHARRAALIDTRAGEAVLREAVDGGWSALAGAVSRDGTLLARCSHTLSAVRLPDGQLQEGGITLGIGGPYFGASLIADEVACFVMRNWRDPARLIFARITPA
jgi:Leucine-rich repeat (LRR) protein